MVFSLMTCESCHGPADRLLIGYQDTAHKRLDFNQADISESMEATNDS